MKEFRFKIEFECPYTSEIRQRDVEYRAKTLNQARIGLQEYLNSNPNMRCGRIVTQDELLWVYGQEPDYPEQVQHSR